jgi:hypothetical protein
MRQRLRPSHRLQRLTIRYRLRDDQEKAVLLRELPEERDFSRHERCYIAAESRLSGIARMSVALITMPGWKYYESRPAHLKPGRNRVFFELQKATWKTGEPVPEGQSEFCRAIEDLSAVRRFVILIYPLQSDGTVILDEIEFKRKP